MFILNSLVQIWAFIAAIIVAFNHGVLRAIALVAVVGAMHFVFSKLSNGLMYLHQKTMMRPDELQALGLMALLCGRVRPRPWTVIATVCGLLFFVCANAVILLFLNS
jgi:hypothetical protein